MNIFQKFACHRSGAFTSGKKLWKNLWENYKQDRVSSSLPRSRFLDVTQRSPKRGKRGVGGGGGGGGALRDIQKTAARESGRVGKF